jgi:hypothetical protein
MLEYHVVQIYLAHRLVTDIDTPYLEYLEYLDRYRCTFQHTTFKNTQSMRMCAHKQDILIECVLARTKFKGQAGSTSTGALLCEQPRTEFQGVGAFSVPAGLNSAAATRAQFATGGIGHSECALHPALASTGASEDFSQVATIRAAESLLGLSSRRSRAALAHRSATIRAFFISACPPAAAAPLPASMPPPPGSAAM